MVTLQCDFCHRLFERRALFLGLTGPHIFCSRKCHQLHRRKWKSDTQKKAEKAAYDRIYRAKNLKAITEKKAAYFQRTYNPEVAAKQRQRFMHRHVAYCRRPEYRRWKTRYDAAYRARKYFGDFAESVELLKRLDAEVSKRMSDYEIRLQQGTLNKRQQRTKQLPREKTNRQTRTQAHRH